MKRVKEEKKDSHEGLKAVTTWFDDGVINRLDRLALKGDIPRSRLIRNLTEIGVEYLETCEKFGVLQTVLILRDFKKRVKDWSESGVSADVEKA